MVIGFECDVVVVGVWCVSNFFSLFEIGAKKTELFFCPSIFEVKICSEIARIGPNGKV